MGSYQDHAFHDRIQTVDDAPVAGPFIKSGAPSVIESCGSTPIEFVVLDAQHANYDYDRLEHALRAADLVDLPALVRVPRSDTTALVNYLDAGAHGLIVPQVESRDEIEEVVAATQYDQDRSFAMSTRAGDYGARDKDAYLSWATENTVIIPQIESAAGLEAVEDIGAVEGVTALMVGPADLSLDCGFECGSAAFDDAVTRIQQAAAASQCGYGMYVATPTEVENVADACSFVICGSELGHTTARLNQLGKQSPSR